ncbi:MAG TPA: hypothetical protein VMV94_19990 [Phycisphaerae bacterium]|nr:hypothetical protein [Phycisphaerae bacterium]
MKRKGRLIVAMLCCGSAIMVLSVEPAVVGNLPPVAGTTGTTESNVTWSPASSGGTEASECPQIDWDSFTPEGLLGPPTASFGACCITTSNGTMFCTMTTEPQCLTASGVFRGVGTTCRENPCSNQAPQTGACCISTPIGLRCIMTTATRCARSNGMFQEVGTQCSENPCDIPPPQVGACCVIMPNRAFCIVTDEQICTSHQGIFHGDGTECSLDLCSPSPSDVGACCVTASSGAGLCIMATEGFCTEQKGTFMGVGSQCNTNPCNLPPPPPPSQTGACCLTSADGIPSCVMTTEQRCAQQSGTFTGVGTLCNTNPCNLPPPQPPQVGACCLKSPGGTASCVTMTEQMCARQNGTFIGVGTNCGNNPCNLPPPAVGACCMQSMHQQRCTVLSVDQCAAHMGRYLGDGTTCSATACSP